jgi:hypothetical protein
MELADAQLVAGGGADADGVGAQRPRDDAEHGEEALKRSITP